MTTFGVNQFSSIENSKHIAPITDYEVLEWPRPICTPPLTHVAIKLDSSREVLYPVLLGEYENLHQAKGKFDIWTNLLGVKQENINEIIQATTALSAIIDKFGYKTSLNSIKNWAVSLEENWPEYGPISNLNTFHEKLLKTQHAEKLIPELGIFWQNGQNSLKFRLRAELKTFLNFLDKRTLYDNFSAITRISWMARKEMGIWSRTWLDKLILLTEQTLNFRLYSQKNVKNPPFQNLCNVNDWQNYMFHTKSGDATKTTTRIEKMKIKIFNILNTPEKSSNSEVSTDEENDEEKYKIFRKSTFTKKRRVIPWRKLNNAKNYVLVLEK